MNDNKDCTEMDELRKQLRSEARRHSNKLIKKLIGGNVDLSEIAKDAIHAEMQYSTLDGYRATMKATRNGDMQDGTKQKDGNR